MLKYINKQIYFLVLLVNDKYIAYLCIRNHAVVNAP